MQKGSICFFIQQYLAPSYIHPLDGNISQSLLNYKAYRFEEEYQLVNHNLRITKKNTSY